MSSLPGRLMLCLLLSFVIHIQGLQFVMDRNRDSVYCGHLMCLADRIFTDSNIVSVVGLTVYDVTQSNTSVKLASLMLFDPQVYVDQTKLNVINVTSNISSYHADIILSLRDNHYCLNGSFVCELDFVDANGQPHVIRETVSPGSSGNCAASFNQIVNLATEIKAHSNELETENAELRQENLAVKTELSNALYQLSQLQEIVNRTQQTCRKGMPHIITRETVLLWDKVTAVCDTETDGGGWIVIQRRTKGDVNFYRGWEDYKNGFGTPNTDFWIGNEVIHNLTSSGYTELRVDMEYQGKQYFAHYSHFDVAAETSLYRLSVSGYNGTAWDGLTFQDGRSFSTFDKDNDDCACNCADGWGAWWYNGNSNSNYCYRSNLNGKWGAQDMSGLAWAGVVYPGSVSMSEMKVRHV